MLSHIFQLCNMKQLYIHAHDHVSQVSQIPTRVVSIIIIIVLIIVLQVTIL